MFVIEQLMFLVLENPIHMDNVRKKRLQDATTRVQDAAKEQGKDRCLSCFVTLCCFVTL